MPREKFWAELALGAAAGLIGTMALQAMHTADQRWVQEGTPPIQQDPGAFMLHKAGPALPERLRQRAYEKESTISKLLALGYGMTFGALYAALRPGAKRLVREGALLGVGVWAVGYLGWLPAAGLMPPVWKHKPKQIATPVAEHALYGLATTAGYRLLHKLV